MAFIKTCRPFRPRVRLEFFYLGDLIITKTKNNNRWADRRSMFFEQQFKREASTYTNLSQKFVVPQRNYGMQYSHLYFSRLNLMRSRLEKSATVKWGLLVIYNNIRAKLQITILIIL